MAARKKVFVTVGTTSFEKLIETVNSPELLAALQSQGYDEITVQIGRGKFVPVSIGSLDGTGPQLAAERPWRKTRVYRYDANYMDDVRTASLIISHAGAGSIMDGLSHGKTVIVVVNDELMDNHQTDLAQALEQKRVLLATTCTELVNTVCKLETTPLERYDVVDCNAFPALVDEEMGVASNLKRD